MKLVPHSFTLRQLQYVVAVADRKSFRRAAEDCHVAQPSLSAQVAQIEGLLGVRLFTRDQRNVRSTTAGETFVARARSLLLMADDLAESARGLTDPLAGRVRIGVIPTVAPYLLGLAAPHLRKKLPKLAFVWIEEKTGVLMERLERGELDAAIVALEAEVPARLNRAVIGKDPFVLATAHGHRLARRPKAIGVEELAGEAVLILDDGHCFREQVLSFCARAGLEEASFRATSLPTLVQMTAGGDAVTLLPTLSLPVENRHGALAIRPFAPKVPARTIALVWRRESAIPVALEAISRTLADHYPKSVSSGPRASRG